MKGRDTLNNKITAALNDIDHTDGIIREAEAAAKDADKKNAADLKAKVTELRAKLREDKTSSHKMGDLDYPKDSTLTIQQLEKLHLARRKNRELALAKINLLELAVEELELRVKPASTEVTDRQAKIKSEKSEFEADIEKHKLTAEETTALAEAKKRKDAATEAIINEQRDKLLPLFKQIDDVRTNLSEKRIKPSEAITQIELIEQKRIEFYSEIYKDQELLEDEASRKNQTNLANRIKECKEEVIANAQKEEAGLADALRKELTPIAERVAGINKQFTDGGINAVDAVKAIDDIMQEGEKKYDAFIKTNKPVMSLQGQLEEFRVAAVKIRDNIALAGVKQTLTEFTEMNNSLLEPYNKSKPKFAVAGAGDDAINHFAAYAKACEEALAAIRTQCEENSKNTQEKLKILGASKFGNDPINAEAQAAAAAKKSFDDAVNEIDSINGFICLFKEAKTVTEAIHKTKLAPGLKTLANLGAELATLSEDLRRLQKNSHDLFAKIGGLPESDLTRELKLSLQAIDKEFIETTKVLTKLEDLVQQQTKLVDLSRETISAINTSATNLDSIKNDEDALKAAKIQLESTTERFKATHDAFLANHCPKGMPVVGAGSFMASDIVSQEARDAISRCVDAAAAHLKAIDDNLNRIMENKPVGLVAAYTHAASTINDLNPNTLDSIATAIKIYSEINADLESKYNKAKPAEQIEAAAAIASHKTAVEGLQRRIYAARKQYAVQEIQRALTYLNNNIDAARIRTIANKQAALDKIQDVDDELLDHLAPLPDAFSDIMTPGVLDADVKREYDAYVAKLNSVRDQINALPIAAKPEYIDGPIPVFINNMKTYIKNQHDGMDEDNLADLQERLVELDDDYNHLKTEIGKSVSSMTPDEAAAHGDFLNEYTAIRKKLTDNISRLTTAAKAATPGRPVDDAKPGSKEAVAESRARFLRAKELFELIDTAYNNASNNEALQAQLSNEHGKRRTALTAARNEVDAQIQIRKGADIKIDALKTAANDAANLADVAESDRRALARGVPGVAGCTLTAEQQFAMFRKQMHPLYIDRCINTLKDLERKAQLLTETAYNEEAVTKIEIQANQIRKDLADYWQLLVNINEDRRKAAADRVYKKPLDWPNTTKVLEDTVKIGELGKPSTTTAPVHTNLFASIQSKVNEARENHAKGVTENYMYYSDIYTDNVKVYRSKDKNSYKELQKDLRGWLGQDATLKPDAFGFAMSVPSTDDKGNFDYRLSMKQIDIHPELLEREKTKMRYAVVEEKPENKSYYKATFYAADITLMKRIPDAKRWTMIYESYMQGMATGVKPDLRIPNFPKALQSLEVDFKAVAVAYGLLQLDSFSGDERKEVEKRLNKIEAAAAEKNPQIPLTLKKAAEVDAAIDSLSASTRLIPGARQK